MLFFDLTHRRTTSLAARRAARRPARNDVFTRTAALRWLHLQARIKRWHWCSLPPVHSLNGAWRLFTIQQFRPTPAAVYEYMPSEVTDLPRLRRPAGYGITPAPLSTARIRQVVR